MFLIHILISRQSPAPPQRYKCNTTQHILIFINLMVQHTSLPSRSLILKRKLWCTIRYIATIARTFQVRRNTYKDGKKIHPSSIFDYVRNSHIERRAICQTYEAKGLNMANSYTTYSASFSEPTWWRGWKKPAEAGLFHIRNPFQGRLDRIVTFLRNVSVFLLS